VERRGSLAGLDMGPWLTGRLTYECVVCCSGSSLTVVYEQFHAAIHAQQARRPSPLQLHREHGRQNRPLELESNTRHVPAEHVLGMDLVAPQVELGERRIGVQCLEQLGFEIVPGPRSCLARHRSAPRGTRGARAA
jgi:hypothetical protein